MQTGGNVMFTALDNDAEYTEYMECETKIEEDISLNASFHTYLIVDDKKNIQGVKSPRHTKVEKIDIK